MLAQLISATHLSDAVDLTREKDAPDLGKDGGDAL
jgi:hypothetical protein